MAGLKFNIEVNLKKIENIIKKLDSLKAKLAELDKSSPNFEKFHKELDSLSADLKNLQKQTDILQDVLSKVSVAKEVVNKSQQIRKRTDEAGESVKKYTDSLDSLRSEMKKVSAEINAMSEAQRKSEQGGNAKQKYGILKGQLKAASDELRRYAKEHTNLINVQEAADGSLRQLRSQLSLLNAEYDGLSREMRTGAAGKALIGQIQTVTKELNEAEQASMRFYRNVGNYASGWNGLQVQVQQMARELPSLAVGANTFFLAISNNLPMLVDEISRAKKELASLRAEGKKGVPVWKQLGASFFSWQTALVIGLTVLSTKGKDIMNWIGSLFSGDKFSNASDILKNLSDAQKGLNEALKDGMGDYGRQAVLVSTLADSWKELGDNLEAQKRFINENKSSFSELGVAIGDVNEADNLLVKNTEVFIRAMALRAEAAAAFKLATEQAEEALKKEVEIKQEKKEGPSTGNKLYAGVVSYFSMSRFRKKAVTGEDVHNKEITLLEKEKKAANTAKDAYTELYNSKIKAAAALLKQAGFKEGDEGKGSVKAAKDYNSEVLRLRQENEDREISLMKDGTEKQLAEIEARYRRETEKVKALENNLRENQKGKLDSEQENMFIQAYTSISKAKESEIKEVYDTEAQNRKERQDAEEKANNEYLRKYGDYLQKRKALAEFYEKEAANAQTEGEKKIKTAEYEKALEELDNDLMKSSELWNGLFSDFSNRSSSAIRGIIKDIESLISYMQGMEGATVPDIFKDNKKTVEAINKAMSDPKTAKKFTDSLKAEITKFKKMLDEDNPFKMISDGFKNKDSESIVKGFNAIGLAVGQLQSLMSDLGIEADSVAGKITSVIGKGASYAATGAQIGGTWGAAIGGALGVTSGLFGLFGADYSGYERMKENYDTLISVWDDLISKKTEYISIDYGIEAQKAAEEAQQLIKTNITRQKTLLEKLGTSGSGKFSHSLNKRIEKRLNDMDWNRISNLIGQKVGKATDLWSLPAEQVEKLLTDEKLVSVLTTVNADFVEYLQNIVKYGDQLEDIAEKEKEAVTGISFDEFRNSFTNLLLDLDSTNEQFANDFEKHIQNAILNSLIANKYADRIKDLYESWQKMGSDGLENKELEILRKTQQDIVNDLLAEREQIKKDFDWVNKDPYEQKASSKGFAAMSQETGDELIGRFTAMYEADLRREAVQAEQLTLMQTYFTKDPIMTGISVSVDSIISELSSINSIANDTRDLIANSYLELQVISESTSNLTKPVKNISTNIEKVKENTDRL